MRTTIDRAGRIVVPKALREALGLTGGSSVEIERSGNELVITPAGPRVEVVEGARGPVLAVDAPVDPLTTEDVRDLIERGRR